MYRGPCLLFINQCHAEHAISPASYATSDVLLAYIHTYIIYTLSFYTATADLLIRLRIGRITRHDCVAG